MLWVLGCVAASWLLPATSQQVPNSLPVLPTLDVSMLSGFDGFVATGPAGVQGKLGGSVAMGDVNGDGLRSAPLLCH